MRIVSRDEWGARPPRDRRTMPLPAQRVWQHHTAADEPDGPPGVRQVQDYHMDVREWLDGAYSFMVDRDGWVYEMRGAGVEGAHTCGDNDQSHGICAFGDYRKDRPTEAMLTGISDLLAYGYEQGWWPEPALTGGHQDAPGADTSCPGPELMAEIPTINEAARNKARDSGEERDMATGYCEHGDEGWRVGLLQRKLQDVDGDALPEYGVDESYGDETASELVRVLAETAGWGRDWDGRRLTHNAAATLDGVHARAWADG